MKQYSIRYIRNVDLYVQMLRVDVTKKQKVIVRNNVCDIQVFHVLQRHSLNTLSVQIHYVKHEVFFTNKMVIVNYNTMQE